MDFETLPTPIIPEPDATPIEDPEVPKTLFILGPSLDNVFEPFPVTVEPGLPEAPHRREVSFRDPATSPGGVVNLQILPPVNDDDKVPVNAYAFFCSDPAGVPIPAARTPEWFFKSGAPVSSAHLGSADSEGAFSIAVPGVRPSLTPYFVQIVLEFPIG